MCPPPHPQPQSVSWSPLAPSMLSSQASPTPHPPPGAQGHIPPTGGLGIPKGTSELSLAARVVPFTTELKKVTTFCV